MERTNRGLLFIRQRHGFRRGLLILGWFVLCAAAVIWLGSTPAAILREQLKHLHFWLLEAQFAGLLAGAAICLPALFRTISPGRTVLWQIAGISVLTVILTGLAAPRTSRIYYDEQIYQSIGQNLCDLRLAQMCNEGNVEYGRLQCTRGEYNKQPYGYPYLLGVIYRLAGVHPLAASILNNLLAGLMIWVIFLTVLLLAGDQKSALLAGLVFSLIPVSLLWSNTAAAEPSAAFFAALAFLSACWFVRTRNGAALCWMVMAHTFAFQFRPESLLTGLASGLMLLLECRRELWRERFWWALLPGSALLTGLAGHLFTVRAEGWGAAGDKLSTVFFWPNLEHNLWHYLDNRQFPLLFSLLALAGLFLYPRLKVKAALLLYFLAFVTVYLFFYAGSYGYGADIRFALMTYPPLAMLAGLGAGQLTGWLGDTGKFGRHAWLAVAGLIAAGFLPFLPLVRATGEEAWAARADVAFAGRIIQDLPPNSIVLTHNPGLFHLSGISAAQASLASSDQPYIRNVLFRRYAGGVYFHWNFWCNVDDPLQQSFCTNILDRYPHQLLFEQRIRDYRYALYRLLPEEKPAHRPDDLAPR